jgi:hypothetical protein
MRTSSKRLTEIAYSRMAGAEGNGIAFRVIGVEEESSRLRTVAVVVLQTGIARAANDIFSFITYDTALSHEKCWKERIPHTHA